MTISRVAIRTSTEASYLEVQREILRNMSSKNFKSLIYRLSFILGIKQLVYMFISYVQPHIQCAVVIYGNSNKKTNELIETNSSKSPK